MALTDEQQLEKIKLTKEKLTARKKVILARKHSKDKKIRERREHIFGKTANAHMEHDPEFHDYYWTVLNNRVTRPADREFLGLKPLGQKDPKD